MNYKKYFTYTGLALAAFALCYFINKETLASLLEKLIFNAVSILVGLSIAVIGIFLNSINTIFLSIYKIVKVKDQMIFTEKEIKKIKGELSDLVDELKENAFFSLYTFIAVLILFFAKEIDIPHLQWFIQDSFLTKAFCTNVVIMFGNFLIFWAIIDSIKVVFQITKAFELMHDD